MARNARGQFVGAGGSRKDTISVKLTKGWREFGRAMNKKRVQNVLATEMGRELSRQVEFLRADVIRYIDTAKHGVPNSPLTILTKKSSRPLVDRGDLRMAINGRTDAYPGGKLVGAVGVLRSRRTRDGRSLVNVAAALHDGFTVRVTPAVRAAVFAEMRKRNPKGVFKGDGSGGSSTWRVKGRPFIETPLKEATPRIKAALGDGVKVTLERV